MSRKWILAAALIAVAPAFVASATEEPRAIVDVFVLDREGSPIVGLERTDFEIAVGNQSRRVADARMVLAEQEPRRFVFVINRRGATGSQLRRMKKGLERFVSARFGARDQALFVDFAEVPRITRGWRVGHMEAAREISNIIPIGFRSALGLTEDVADAAFMLQALAGRLSGITGRKVVVLFSTSLSTFGGSAGETRGLGRSPSSGPGSISSLPSAQADADEALRDLAHAFNAARASIYAVHLEGALRQENGILEASREETGAISSSSLSSRRRYAFARPTDDFLSSLAVDTGGAYTARTTDFARVLGGIEASHRLWYELKFEPFGANIPGRYQNHAVRVRNRPGLTVIVRSGHVVPE